MLRNKKTLIITPTFFPHPIDTQLMPISAHSPTWLATVNIYQTPAAARPALNKNADPFSFFRQSALKKGNLFHLPNLQESLPNRAFLPTQIASKIPLTYDHIAKIFPQASSIETTKDTIQNYLYYCNAAAIECETKGCPKSLEEMVGFAKSALGEKNLWALTSKINSAGSSSEMMIRKMKQYLVEKIVACHEAFLPFAAYFCLSLPSTRFYAVELVDPARVNSVGTSLKVSYRGGTILTISSHSNNQFPFALQHTKQIWKNITSS